MSGEANDFENCHGRMSALDRPFCVGPLSGRGAECVAADNFIRNTRFEPSHQGAVAAPIP
jgi:hypothetical protein